MKAYARHETAPNGTEQTDAVVSTVWYAAADNRREALALRHRGYVHAGLIEASPFGIYTDPYDDLETTIVAGLFRRGACIATLRLSVYVPGRAAPALPCETVYPEVEAIKARADGLVIELSRLAIDPDINNTRYRARLYAAAIRAGVAACVALNARHLLVATQTKWRSFYEHVLNFSATGPAQFYPPGDVPVILLQRALDADLRKRMANNMFFKLDEREVDDLRTRLPGLIGLELPAAELTGQ